MKVIDISKIVNDNRKIICFTGHRPNRLSGYTNKLLYNIFVKKLKEMLIPLI